MTEAPEKTNGSYRTVRWIMLAVLLCVWLVLAFVQWRLFRFGAGGSLTETLGAFALVNVNILLLLFLTLRNLAKLVFERRQKVLGSRLKTKLVLAFLATTMIPTTILFVASAGFLARSIDGWFSTRVEQALENAMEVARTYYAAEEKTTLQAGHDLAVRLAGRNGSLDRAELERLLNAALSQQHLTYVRLIPAEGEAITVRGTGELLPPDPKPDDKEVRDAQEGRETVIHLQDPSGDVLRAFYPIRRAPADPPKGVVVVDRGIPIQSLQRLQQITTGFEEYRQSEHLKAAIKASYIFPLLLVALLITFAVTWFGFYLARTITEPIGALADATERIAEGDLDFQLEVSTQDEVGKLVDSFNVMTRDLKLSREKVEAASQTLTQANIELESGRIHMKAVMDKVSAGVVSADAVGKVTTINPAAQEMLGVGGDVVGRHYQEVFPAGVLAALEPMLEEKMRKHADDIRRQVLLPAEGMGRTVMVHMTTLRDESGVSLGMVVVLNDLTDLVKAERAQAWREVARRIAHEIKNPLTPIQLSAQRLRRRYSALLEDADGQVLDEATRTIVAQVDSLKHLVNEFSRFAKMPEANPVPSHFNEIVEDVIGLYRPAHPEIHFDIRLEGDMPIVEVDPAQVKRAVVNLLDNAVSALSETEHRLIEILTEHDPDRRLIRLSVADTGPGLSPKAREHLFEPYFSTKKGGTGLGLAIVKSIMADHKGYVKTHDNKPQGTRFILEFPLPGAEA